MSSKQADFLAKLRDAGQIIVDASNELLKSMAPPELGVENKQAAVNELTFSILKWDPQKGAQLGEFYAAYKASNIEEKWQHSFNILRSSNATIKYRYHGTGYSYSYWVYGQDKIYRQKPTPKNSN